MTIIEDGKLWRVLAGDASLPSSVTPARLAAAEEAAA
jgi:hypothetical protein